MRSRCFSVAVVGFCALFILLHAPPHAPFCEAKLAGSLEGVRNWFILLNDDDSAAGQLDQQMQSFDMAILDPDRHFAHPDREKGKPILIGYVSLGEAESYRFYWERVKDRPWILWENPDWKGNYLVDVRSDEWRTLLIDNVIPAVMEKGFRGLFLDTLDTAVSLEERESKKYSGCRAAMVGLIQEIHKKYPDLLLISNNGLELLPQTAPFLSGVLVEDIHSMPDFEKGGYKEVPPEDRQEKVRLLKQMMEKYSLPVFIVDYVARSNKEKARECSERSRALGFKPYIAEKELSEIYMFGLEQGS